MANFPTPNYQSKILAPIKNGAPDTAAVLLVITEELKKVKAYHIVVDGSSVSFMRGMSYSHSYLPRHPINAITRGEIHIEKQPDSKLLITYKLVFSEVLIVATVVAFMIVIFLGAAQFTLSWVILLATIFWLFMGLGSVIYAIFWFRSFLGHCITITQWKARVSNLPSSSENVSGF